MAAPSVNPRAKEMRVEDLWPEDIVRSKGCGAASSDGARQLTRER